MKHVFLSMLAFAAIITSMAQSYIPTFTESKKWTYTDGTTLYATSGDDGYTQLSEQEGTPSEISIWRKFKETDGKVVANTASLLWETFLTKDEFKRYATLYDDENFVFFDYNLQPGDTLNVYEGYTLCTSGDYCWLQGKTIKVVSIDTLLIDNKPHRRYNLISKVFDLKVAKSYEDFYYTYGIEPFFDAWIEGIGYINWTGVEYNITRLDSVTDNGEVIYSYKSAQTFKPDREWTYVKRNSTDTIYINAAEGDDGYVNLNTPFNLIRRVKETDNLIVAEIDDVHFLQQSELTKYFDRYATMYDSRNVVLFDYGLQKDDTLNLYENTVYDADSNTSTWSGQTLKKVGNTTYRSINGLRVSTTSLNTKPFTRRIVGGADTYEDSFSTEEWSLHSNGFNWIESIGADRYVYDNEYYELQCVSDNGINIYTADGADCNRWDNAPNSKIDFNKLSLHRTGQDLSAVFPAADKDAQLTLYNATGQAVRSQAVRKGATSALIPMQGLAKGVYIVALTNCNHAKPMTAKVAW